MRVAYFCDTYTPQINGVTNTMEQLYKYIEENRIDAIFFVPKYNHITQNEKNVHRFFSLKAPIYHDCRLVIPPAFKVQKILDKFKPDLIHVITEFGVSLSGIWYAKKRGVPLISSYTSNFDQYLDYYNIPWLHRLLNKYLKWFHSNCSLTFCPSDQSRGLLNKLGVSRVEIMKRGVDKHLFSPNYRDSTFRSRIGAENDSIVFTYVGRIAPEKDLDILVECIHNIKNEFGKKAVFVFVGGGPKLEDIKSKIGKLAFFTGYLRGNQLSEAYASSDVFVFPSTSETFGNVVLEAFASGLPAIVPNAGGVAEIVTHGYDGYIVPPRDSEAMTLTIKSILENPERISIMRENALQSAHERTWQGVFSKMFNQYKTVIPQ